MERGGKEDLCRINGKATRGQIGGCGERTRLRPVNLSLRPTLWVRVNQRNDLDVGIIQIRADVKVVDPTEADERGPDRPVIRIERHVVQPSVGQESCRVVRDLATGES
jgi:hypothetical protein